MNEGYCIFFLINFGAVSFNCSNRQVYWDSRWSNYPPCLQLKGKSTRNFQSLKGIQQSTLANTNC